MLYDIRINYVNKYDRGVMVEMFRSKKAAVAYWKKISASAEAIKINLIAWDYKSDDCSAIILA